MKRTNNLWMLGALVMTLGLAGCSTTPDDPYADERDPFEDVNRDLWDFNQDLDEWVISPAADVYGTIPKPVRDGLYNVVDNLDEPSSTVNNILQWKLTDAGVSISRFVINSTVGLLGFFDVAEKIGLDKRQEGFGEVLASWGVMDGPYVMLPGLGPTVVVDRGGDYVDGTYFPFDLLSTPVNIARWTIYGLETRIRLRDQEQVLENSLDSYAFVREAYFQNWQDKVYDGNPPVDEEFDDYDDSYYEDDAYFEEDDSFYEEDDDTEFEEDDATKEENNNE